MEGIGFVMLIPILIALIYGETDFGGYLISGILSISVGYILDRVFKIKLILDLNMG
jgi:trk system potassium uptake protein TrkH